MIRPAILDPAGKQLWCVFQVMEVSYFEALETLLTFSTVVMASSLFNFRGHSFLVEDMAVTANGIYLVSSSNFQRTQGREVIWWQVDPPRQIWRWMVTVYPYDHLFTADFQQEEGVLYNALGGIRSWRLVDGIQDHLDTKRVNSLASLTSGPVACDR